MDAQGQEGRLRGDPVSAFEGDEQPTADLQMRLSGPAAARVGARVSYRIRVRNGGPDVGEGVAYVFHIPAGAEWVGATGGGEREGSVVRFPRIDRLGPGEEVSDTVTVRYPDPGDYVAEATVDGGLIDLDPSNNRDEVHTAVSEPDGSDLEVRKSGPSTADVGEEVPFVITTKNLGPAPAEWVDVTDQLPEGARFVRATRGHVVEGRTVRWDRIYGMAAGATVRDTVWVTFSEPGRYVNRARSDQPGDDPQPGNDQSSATITVEDGGGSGGDGGADLEMRMVGPERAALGETVAYELRVRNLGPDPASGVRVRHTVPDGGTFVRATGDGVLSGSGIVEFPVRARLNAGGQVFDTVFVRYDQTGRFVNRARVTGDTDDPDPSNNEDDEPTTVGDVPLADVRIVKSGPDTVSVGETVTYLLTTTNLGPDLADWVYVEDRLPEGAEFVSASRAFTLDGRTIRWEMIHIIEPGAPVQDTVRVIYRAPGEYVNRASVTELTDDPNPENDDSSVRTVVREGGGTATDVAIELTGPTRAEAGDDATYQLRARSLGPGAAAGVRLQYRVPDGAEFVEASAEGRLDEDGWVRWSSVDELAPGAAVERSVTVLYPEVGEYRHRAVVETDSRDSNPDNNTRTLVTEVEDGIVSPDEADLSVRKTGPAEAAVGDTLEYLITTTNAGPAAARDVVVVDILPPGWAFLSASRQGTEVGGTVTWPVVPTLAAGASLQDTIRVAVPGAGTFVNLATVTSATSDPDGDNNGSSVEVEVTDTIPPGVDLALDQSVAPASVEVGEAATFSLTVRNVGADTATGSTTVSSVIPPRVAFSSASSGDSEWAFEFDEGTRAFQATYGQALPPGGTTSFDVLVSAVDTTEAVHSAVVANAEDGNAANDTAVARLEIRPDTSGPAQGGPLLLTKRALSTELSVGDPVTYALEVTNDGPSALTDVLVRDAPAGGFRYRTGTTRLDGRGVEDPVIRPDSLVFAVGRVGPGETRTLVYRMVVGANAPTGRATNTAVAVDRATATTSLPATASVQVRDGGVFTDEALILGRVWAEIDSVRLGIPAVRVYLQDGTSAITDAEGNYSFVGLRPRLWVVRVDQSTLPAAVDLKPVTGRHAGVGTSVFADLMRGELHRVDFGAFEEEGDSLWYVAKGEVQRRRRMAAEAERDRRGGITWPMFNGWMRDSTDVGVVPGLPSAFGDILPEGSINAGNSNLGPRPADPVSAGLMGERASMDGPLRIALDPARPAIAVGDSSVVITVSVEDTASAVVTLEATRGRWLVEDLDPVAPGVQVLVRGATDVKLGAPGTPGDGWVRATSRGREVDLIVPWTGDRQRPFLLTGLIEAQVDGRSLETAELLAGRVRDRFQDRLEEWAFDSNDGRYWGGMRAAGYATGDIGAETSLTLRFDTEKDPNRRFFDDIRPEDFYGIYGDASLKSFGAQSRGRVFGALERGRSFLMYGDFLTGAGRSEALSLGRYSRTLNGVAQHYEGGMGALAVRLDGFASYDRASQVVDEIRGLGISGPYALSRSDGLINSEQVEILIRDRNQPSLILRRETLTRFLDYSVEPFTGRLLFKRPIPSLDDQLNPVSVRVTYEVEEAGDRFWVYGVDGAVRAADRVEVGAGLVRDENELGGIDLSSANATVEIARNTFLLGEFARSDSAQISGDAGRVELRHASGRVDARAYFVEADSTFSNPSSGISRGRRDVGVRARADLTDRLQLLGEAIRSESLVTGGEREGAQVGLRLGRAWSGEVGYRYAEEAVPLSAETADVGPYDVNSLRARITAPLPEATRGAVFAEYEQDVNDGDQRRLLVGGDLRLFDRARLYGRHELISSFVGPYGLNPFQEQNNTVFGISADYREGTQVFSEYRAQDAFEGREAQAAMGLRNRWAVADGLRIDTSLERLSPIGSEGQDALAITGAVAYTASPTWKGTMRGEYRASDDQDHILGSLGYAGRLTEDWTLLGHGVLSHVLDGPTYERSRIGLAYRDLESNAWNTLFRYEHKYEQEPRTGFDWNRTAHVFSSHLNYRPADALTFSAQYGAKVVTEEVDDEESTGEPASLLGARIVYDLGAHFDVGVLGWALRTGSLVPAGGSFGLGEDIESPESRYALGAELGWTPIENLRIAGGYNAFGFIEDDFLPDQPTDHGFYVRVGYKIDRFWGDAPIVTPPPADVGVTKMGPERIVVERPAEYLLFPRNEGPDTARAVEIEDLLPPGSQVLEASEGAEVVGDTIRWRLGDLEPGDAPAQTVTVQYADTGQAINRAAVESRSPDPNLANNVARDTTQVVPYELRIRKTGPGDALPDDSVAYAITVTNLGPRDATDLIITDSLPVGALFGRADSGGDYENGVVTWDGITLAAGDSIQVGLVVTYPLAGRYTNVARVNAPIAPDRADHAIEIGLPADVRLSLFGPRRVVTGDTVPFLLHVYNDGPGTARNARAQMVIPPRARVVSTDPASSEFAGRVAWSLGELPPAGERALELAVVFDSVGLYPMEGRVFSDFDDDSQTDRRTLFTRAYDWDLDVAISADVGPDRTVEYVIRTHNRGSGPAPYVVVEDSVATGGRVLDASRGALDLGDIVRWPEVDALPGGGTQFDTVRVQYDQDGVYTAVATASADGYTVKDRIRSLVGSPADVKVDKLGRVHALVGDTMLVTLRVYNDGSGEARHVSVVDSVPPGASVSNVEGGGGLEGDVLRWTVGDLAPGGEAFLTYDLTYGNPGTYRNHAFLSAPNDRTPDNDWADLVTRIDSRAGLRPLPSLERTVILPIDGLALRATGTEITAVGRSTSYEAFLWNRSSVPETDVRMSLTVPEGAVVDSVGGGGTAMADSVVWTLPELEGGGELFGTVLLSYPDTGEVRVVATASSSEALMPLADTVWTQVVGALPTIHIDGDANALPGDTVTYVVTLTQDGSGPLDGLVVEDSIPAGATFIGASRGGRLEGSVVRWPAVEIDGASGTVVDTVRISYAEPGRYVNRVTTSPRFPGVRDEFATVVGLAADVHLALEGPAMALVADTALYYVYVYNGGSGDAEGLRVSLDLASGSRLVRVSDGGVVDDAGTVTWPSVQTLGPGAELFADIEIAYDRPGTYRHEATAVSTFDPDLTDVWAEHTTQVLARRLDVRLTGPELTSVRDTLTYVVETTYQGPGRLDEGFVEQVIPPTATFLGASGGGVQNGGVVRWPVPGGFDPGIPRADTVQILFPYGGVYTHVAAAGGGPLMNADSLIITVQPVDEPTPAVVYFDFDRSNINERAEADLLQIAQQLRALDPRIEIALVGHADTVGATDYNDRLGQRRADSVKAFLEALGIWNPRTITRSRGELEPVSTEGTRASHARDRRVVFHFCDPQDEEILRTWPCNQFRFPSGGPPFSSLTPDRGQDPMPFRRSDGARPGRPGGP